MEVKEVLINARELIKDEDSWIQCSFVLDEKGEDVDPIEDVFFESGVCFCADGAILRAAKDFKLYRITLDILRRFTNGYGVILFNDMHTHQEVLNAFDQAIGSLK